MLESATLTNLLLIAILVIATGVILYFQIGSWMTNRRMRRYIDERPRGGLFGTATRGTTITMSSRKAPIRTDGGELRTNEPVKLMPGKIVEIVVRPQYLAFRPERIVINTNPDRWLVHDIKVGNRSQIISGGSIPGVAFSAQAVGSAISFETVQTAMDLVMAVSYEGPEPDGEMFEASITGTSVEHPRTAFGLDVPNVDAPNNRLKGWNVAS